MRHLIDPLDFSQEEIMNLLSLADRICADPAAYQNVAEHKKLATLFYEPSTRTRLSFEAAMLNLGGHVLGFPSETVSSASKGESVADTIRVVSCYADIVAMRHPKEGAPLRASRYSRIPVINAGDGGHQHPTQTMTDLMTIRRRMGRLDNLTIGLCGDLKFGRPFTPSSRPWPASRISALCSSARKSCEYPIISSRTCWKPTALSTRRPAAWRIPWPTWTSCT